MRKNLPMCPVDTAASLMSNRWVNLIIRDLLSGTKRFGELKRSLVISQKVLTENLRVMEEDGLISRKIYPEVPPKVEYSLTDIGRELKSVQAALAKWGKEYKKVQE